MHLKYDCIIGPFKKYPTLSTGQYKPGHVSMTTHHVFVGCLALCHVDGPHICRQSLLLGHVDCFHFVTIQNCSGRAILIHTPL